MFFIFFLRREKGRKAKGGQARILSPVNLCRPWAFFFSSEKVQASLSPPRPLLWKREVMVAHFYHMPREKEEGQEKKKRKSAVLVDRSDVDFRLTAEEYPVLSPSLTLSISFSSLFLFSAFFFSQRRTQMPRPAPASGLHTSTAPALVPDYLALCCVLRCGSRGYVGLW